jgi:sialic acid synthase SpsE
MFAHTSTYIIAEIGSNHDGRLDKALSFVHEGMRLTACA